MTMMMMMMIMMMMMMTTTMMAVLRFGSDAQADQLSEEDPGVGQDVQKLGRSSGTSQVCTHAGSHYTVLHWTTLNYTRIYYIKLYYMQTDADLKLTRHIHYT